MKFHYLFVFVFFHLLSFSQELRHYTLDWQIINRDDNSKILSFKNASYNTESLPLFITSETVKGNLYISKLINKKFIPVTSEEEKILSSKKIANQIIVESHLYKGREKKYWNIHFLPLRKNKNTGKIEKLIAFDIITTLSRIKRLSNRSYTTSNTSLLASGDWIKLGVNKTGVYKITYDEIKKTGVSNPSELRIFGYGGASLSTDNSQKVLDDLQELSCYVYKGSDGVFNSGDYLLFYAEGPVTWKYDNMQKIFTHTKHPYSDVIYYFLACNKGVNKTIETKTKLTGGELISKFLDKKSHENNSINLIKSGSLWLGKELNNLHNSYSFNFSFPNIINDSNLFIYSSCVARSPISSSIYFKNNGNNIQTNTIAPINMNDYLGYYAQISQKKSNFKSNSSNINLSVQYSQSNNYSAWIDFVDINAVRKLKLESEPLIFTNVYHIGTSYKN